MTDQKSTVELTQQSLKLNSTNQQMPYYLPSYFFRVSQKYHFKLVLILTFSKLDFFAILSYTNFTEILIFNIFHFVLAILGCSIHSFDISFYIKVFSLTFLFVRWSVHYIHSNWTWWGNQIVRSEQGFRTYHTR